VNVLDGIVVLDLTRLLPGAVATQQLVDWGAEVIKIEEPRSGDYAREMNPAVFVRTNRGKKSLAMDLKHPDGRANFLNLARHADVIMEGNRPGVMARLGLGYEVVRERNPRLIYVSLTGYGQVGPYAQLAGHDVNYLALGGVLSLNLPVIPGVQIADLVGGSMQAVTQILLALLARNRTGEGRYIDVSMYDGVKSLLTIPLSAWLDTGREPTAGNEVLSGRYACYSLYQSADGRWLAVGALEPKFWGELCRRLGAHDLVARQFEDPPDVVKDRIASIFRTKSAEDWLDELRDTDCCVTLVRSISEVATEMSDPAGPPPPALGEHTRDILNRYGIRE
jgi:alpha-methylacyl-CoA racemase